MLVLRTQDVDGYVVDARLIGRSARVVVSSYPDAVYGPPELRARPSGWLPRSTLTVRRTGRQVTSRAVGCRSRPAPGVVRRRRRADRLHRRPRRGPPGRRRRRVFTGADTVYALGRRASTSRRSAGTRRVRAEHVDPPLRHLRPGPDDVRGQRLRSPGTLLNQFSLSEDKGILRAATTRRLRPRRREPVTTLDAARRPPACSAARSAASAAASGSTPCASSATSATSSRSARPTRSTRSTSSDPDAPARASAS